ncbi:ThiF family adenylyltransferase [bacterium]|nr:ThiF family adenylyltransferase [Mariniblastus sp.]MDB4481044.1 ThiF family adenylyltransferase [bacterium]
MQVLIFEAAVFEYEKETKGRPLNQGKNNLPRSDRYARQVRFPSIGETGQAALGDSTALIVGCGALGSVIANTLARSGVGRLKIVDRDFLEYSNLQRQVLYDEQDVKNGLPKAIAAADKLSRINSTIEVEPFVVDVDASNVESLCEGVDVILDGSDNFEIRFLLNDVAVKHSIPWVYGGCLGADGQTMTVLPGESACLNCLMLDGPPPPGTSPTCDSFGILSPVINLIASLQSIEAMKILSGNRTSVSQYLTVASLWESELRQMDISGLRDKVDCPTCRRGEFRWLSGDRESHSAVLCGRDAVQISFPGRDQISLDQLAGRLESLGRVEANAFLLRFHIEHYVMTVFPDGRAIVSGTEDLSLARKLYTQYMGS